MKNALKLAYYSLMVLLGLVFLALLLLPTIALWHGYPH